MATVPYSPNATAAPSTDPGGREMHIAADASMFGGQEAGAMQDLGKQLAFAGRNLGSIAEQVQAQQNSTAVDDAFNQLQSKALNRLYGDGTEQNPGFYSLKGRNAMNAARPTLEGMEEDRQALKNVLQNDAQKLQFEQASRRFNVAQQEVVGRHASQQASVWDIATQQAAEKIKLNAIGVNPDSEDEFQHNLADGELAARKRAASAGGGPEVMEAERLKFRQQAFTTRLQGIERTDPAAALKFLQSNLTDFPPEHVNGLQDHLQRKVDGEGDDNYVSGLLGTLAPGTRPQGGGRPSASLRDIHPTLITIKAPGGAGVTVSADAAPKFQGLINDLEAEGYKLDPGTTGGYNARTIAGTDTPSEHAHGRAIDVNWTRNAKGGTSDLPPALARRLAAKWGLTWGGDWSGSDHDPMHFEVAQGGGTDHPSGGATGWKANNPLNITGEGAVTPKGTRLASYDSMVEGIAATAAKLKEYQTDRGLDTVRKMYTEWHKGDPVNETDMAGIAKAVGVGIDQPFTLDAAKAAAWIKQAQPGETGTAGKRLSEADLAAGVAQFNRGSGGPGLASVGATPDGTRVIPASTRTTFDTQKADGMTKPGNLEVWDRPVLRNPGGGYSTTSSMSVGTDDGEVLIPTVIDGKRLSEQEAKKHYLATGENLGTFDTPAHADAYATALHNAQAARYDKDGNLLPARGQPDQAPGAVHPDRSAIVAQIERDTPNPARRAARTAKALHALSLLDIKNETERKDLEHSLPDLSAAALDGKDIIIPEANIRRLLPPADAARTIEQLQISQHAGLVLKAVQWGTPADVAAARADLHEGMGPISAMIRHHGQETMGPVMAPTPGGDEQGSEAYRLRKQILEAFDAKIEARTKMLDTDPAAYTAQAPTVMAAAAQVAASQNADADTKAKAVAGYVNAQAAAQTQVGVPDWKQAVLPKAQAGAMVGALVHATPDKTDVRQQLTQMANEWGPAWPKVFGDLVKANLPGSYQVLATMDQPAQTGAAVDLQSALALSYTKGGTHKVAEAAPPDVVKDIDRDVDGALDDFRRTVAFSNGGAALFDHVKDATKLLAYSYAMKGNSNPLKAAVEGILNAKYDFHGTWRSEKQHSDAAVASANSIRGGLTAADIAPIGGNERLTGDERKSALLSSIRADGAWINNTDDSGIVLTYLARGNRLPVIGANGKPIEIKFNNIPPLRTAPPENPMTTGLMGLH